MIYEQAQKDIIKILRGMTGKWSIYPLWRDFLVLAACTISNHVDMAQWQKREDMYMKTIEKYDKDEANKFAEMLALVIHGLSGSRKGDFLGELYMKLEISNRDVGQFFTPYDVSKMMAQMIGVEEKDGIITLNEPACGSGGMIIAYADVLHSKGINYQEKLRVVCNDLDYDVVKMAYIQLSLLGIDAIIMQGNTITLKMNEVWYTPMNLINRANEQTQKENEQTEKMVEAMNNVIALERPVETVPGQMDIFEFLGG